MHRFYCFALDETLVPVLLRLPLLVGGQKTQNNYLKKKKTTNPILHQRQSLDYPAPYRNE